jgi:hypothetical protein
METSTPIFVGLDCETSARSLAQGARLIQAGIAIRTDAGLEVLSELVSWDEMLWDEGAAAIHNIPREALDAARPAAQVDTAFHNWLVLRTPAETSHQELVSVGFNVASFDHPFFAHAMPRTMGLFSHRAVELNSLCFALDGAPGPDGKCWGSEQWKACAKSVAAERLEARGLGGVEHDAGYDAALALEIFDWLRAQMTSR